MSILTIEQLTSNSDVAPFWRAVQERRFLVQLCSDCERTRFGPRVVCTFCGSMRSEWRQDEGLGTVYSMTTIHRAVYEDGPPRPYEVAIAEMDAGTTFLARGATGVGFAVGDRVQISFEDDGGLVLPVFTLVEPATESRASAAGV